MLNFTAKDLQLYKIFKIMQVSFFLYCSSITGNYINIFYLCNTIVSYSDDNYFVCWSRCGMNRFAYNMRFILITRCKHQDKCLLSVTWRYVID